MAIQAISRNIASHQYLLTPLQNANNQLFMFSGIAIFGEEIKGTSGNWENGTATIDADYSVVIPVGRAILPNFWVVEVHLASIFNRNQAVNTGWAVDEFILRLANDGAGQRVTLVNGHLIIDTKVAVRDSDAFIFRLSYSVSMVGRVIPYIEPPPPCIKPGTPDNPQEICPRPGTPDREPCPSTTKPDNIEFCPRPGRPGQIP